MMLVTIPTRFTDYRHWRPFQLFFLYFACAVFPFRVTFGRFTVFPQCLFVSSLLARDLVVLRLCDVSSMEAPVTVYYTPLLPLHCCCLLALQYVCFCATHPTHPPKSTSWFRCDSFIFFCL